MVGVAQLVEHRVVVPGVAGSSPVTHPRSSSAVPDRPDPQGVGPMALRHRSFARSGHESVRFLVSGMPRSRLLSDNGPVNRGLRSGRRRSTSLVTRFAVLLLGVGVALGLAALSAWAHSAVVSISPPDGATLSTPPTQVDFVFNEVIDPNFTPRPCCWRTMAGTW